MAVARAVIDKAKEGDAVSARFLLGLLCPRPRDRAITLDLPDGMSAGDTVAAFNTTLLAMAAGEITPDEALTITRMFDGRLQALRAWELERQMIWVRREHIPGDELFAPPDEEVEEARNARATARIQRPRATLTLTLSQRERGLRRVSRGLSRPHRNHPRNTCIPPASRRRRRPKRRRSRRRSESWLSGRTSWRSSPGSAPMPISRRKSPRRFSARPR